MSWLLESMLSNAVFVTVMAVAVVVLAPFLRHRPAVVHAMWLIVLLKFVTPPLVSVPVTLPYDARLGPLIASPGPAVKFPSDVPMVRETGDVSSDSLSEPDVTRIEQMNAAGEEQSTASSVFRLLILIAWIGSVVWTILAAVRIVRFAWLLRAARTCDDALASLACQTAERLGLGTAPVIVTVDARISPLVWHAGRAAMIVLPRDLVAQANNEQLELLLAHELAHIKRGDHLVRWLALAVLAVYWWHPVAWWAVRRLRVAEEHCCDAMVVAVSPGRAHAYAKTLLDTLDFLAERPTPPLLASGIDSGGSLKRRCEMILCGQTKFRIGSVTGLLLLLVSISVLPLAATVRAENELNRTNVATQPDSEKDQPKRDERSIAPWHKNSPEWWKTKDCTECHKFSPKGHGVEKALDEFDKQLRTELEKRRANLKELQEEADQLLESMRRVLDLGRATQGLRTLGFEDELIETLIKDRAKAKSANQVLQDILRLTGEEQAKPKKDDAGKE